jgi:hypothetical protein
MTTLPRPGAQRPTRFWLEALRRRALRGDDPDLLEPIAWSSDAEQRAAMKFFNAALRAEESGLRQAHELADEVKRWDPDLGEVLRLYGDEEGWHQRLLQEFLANMGGSVQPMGRVTRFFYSAYARAKRMETIVLTNLMFETIGATTYRMALKNVRHAAARRMLTVLARDESFHVPLNVHFLREVLKRHPAAKRRLRVVHALLFSSLLLLPFASRPKARAFDGIERLELVRAYAHALGGLFVHDPELGLSPPRWVTLLFGRTPALAR